MILVPIQSALHPAGPQAERLSQLFWIFFWICAAVYVIVIGFLIVAMIRGRRNAVAEREDLHPQKVAVATATGITLVILLAMLAMSAATGGRVGTFGQKRTDQLEIDVTGHQWWWEIKYPDPNVPSHTITDANEIHIPTDTPILLRLDTRDVIHSLWIPNLHGKRDLIPGRVNKIWIQADKPGIWRGQCAEFCGMQHAHMSLVVFAHRPADFAQWKSFAGQGGAKPSNAMQEQGRQLFLSMPCANCHNIVGEEAYGTLGPDLTHVASRRTLAAGTLLNNRGNLGGWIVNSQAIKPGNQMPPNDMTSDELQALLVYLESLK